MSSALRDFQLSQTLTLLWDIHPYSFIVEGVFVGIEATEGRIAL